MNVILGIVVAAAGIVCLFLANAQYWELQADVNDRLSPGKKFDPLFWTPVKWAQFHRLHKTVLPNSIRPKRAMRIAALGYFLFLLGVVLVFAPTA